MCHLCWTNKPKFSRRQFLQQSLLAGTATALGACTTNRSTTNIGGDFTAHIQQPLDRTSYPIWAAQIGRLANQQLELVTPNFRQTIELNAQTELRDETGRTVKTWDWDQLNGRTTLVWANEGLSTATTIQLLGSISATDDIPVGFPQPEGTGETRPFGPLNLHTRAGWGAAETTWVRGGEFGIYDPINNRNGWQVYDEPLKEQIHSAAVHHTALGFDHGAQTVQALHMTSAKFADVGYHFIIDGFGELYEGRPFNVRGAHTGGFNTGYVGICLMGNFEIAPPIQSQLNTLRRLLAYLRETYTITHLGGHRDFQPGVTVCPGANLHPLLPQIASQLGYTYQQR